MQRYKEAYSICTAMGIKCEPQYIGDLVCDEKEDGLQKGFNYTTRKERKQRLLISRKIAEENLVRLKETIEKARLKQKIREYGEDGQRLIDILQGKERSHDDSSYERIE